MRQPPPRRINVISGRVEALLPGCSRSSGELQINAVEMPVPCLMGRDKKEVEALATMPPWRNPQGGPHNAATSDLPASLFGAAVLSVGYGQPARAGAGYPPAHRPAARRCAAPVMMELAATMPRHTPTRTGPAAPRRAARTTRR